MAFVGIVNVPALPVIDNPFIDVAVATPNVGVVNVGAVNVLFVNVSVPAKVANVPDAVGKVIATAVVLVPINDILPAVVTVVWSPNVRVALFVGWVRVILFIDVAVATPNVGVVKVGVVNVLFVNVSVPAKVANVPDTVGKVIATAVVLFPINDILPLVVTVVWSPNVMVALFVGWVSVILFIEVAVATPNVGVVKVGAVNVLFVNVSVPAKVANVPEVGNVILVAPVVVNVEVKPPTIANVAFVGIVNVPALPVIDSPFIDLPIVRLPFKDISKLTNKLPLSEVSPTVKSRLLTVTSLPIYNREFNDASNPTDKLSFNDKSPGMTTISVDLPNTTWLLPVMIAPTPNAVEFPYVAAFACAW